MALNLQFLRNCKRFCIQFVIVKPVMAVLSITLLLASEYENPGYQAFMLTVYNLSYTFALYALLLFYLATSDMIKSFSPVRKFLTVKAVVFATYYQKFDVYVLSRVQQF
eukprot:UN03536